jgi:prepilin-type N-terminal cleavage/methylation domain-containing protein
MRMRPQPTTMRPTKRAFTLVEVMISLLVASLVTAGTISIFIFLQRAYYSTSETVGQNGSTRTTEDRLVGEFRAIRDVESIVVDGDGRVRRFTAASRDLATGAPARVTYAFESARSSLVRLDLTTNQEIVLLSRVADVRFTFFARSGLGAGSETVVPASVNAIRIQAIPAARPSTLTGRRIPVVSAVVQLRNRAIQ